AGKPEVRRHATPFHSPHFSKHRFTLQCVPSSGPPRRLASMFQRQLRLSPACGRSLLARFSTLSRRTRYSGAKGLGAQVLVSVLSFGTTAAQSEIRASNSD